MTVTLKQIAELAGVSRGTVDRALHGRGRVDPKVAQRVRQIADELGYRPNKMGRALALARKNLRLGMVIQSAETPFMQMLLDGGAQASATLREMGVTLLIRTLQSLDTPAFLEQVDGLVAEGVSGLALLPSEDDRIRARINALAGREIPVVTVNSDITGTRRLAFVGLDNLQGGRTAAGLMRLALRDQGFVLPLTGHPTKAANVQRVDGFLEECAQAQGLTVLPVQPCFDRDSLAYEVTLQTLGRYPELAGIYVASNGQDGVCRALETAGRRGQVRVITFDLTPQNKRRLQEGAIDIVIGQDAFTQGYRPPFLLYELLVSGISPPAEFLYTDILIKTRHNL